jgi:hypothetical protein
VSHLFDQALRLVLDDVQRQHPRMSDDEALCHVFDTVDLEDLRKLPIPHPSAEGDEAAAVARRNELVDAYRRVLGRSRPPSHDQLADCLALLHHASLDELPPVQRVWLLRACRGDLGERVPTRAQLINLVRLLSGEGVVELSDYQRRWVHLAETSQLV